MNETDRTTRTRTSPGSPTAEIGGAVWLLGLLAIVGCAGTPRGPSGLPTKYSLQSEQLQVHSDFKLEEDDPLIVELQQLRSQVSKELALKIPNRKIVVYLFQNEEAFSRFIRNSHPGLPRRRAFFIGSATELAVYAYWGDEVHTDLRHEYTHGILHSALKNVPLWLDEGLAEYFEVRDSVPNRINPEHFPPLKRAIQNGWEPDLLRLEQLEDINEMHRADYQEAWAWVHYLLHDSTAGRRILLDYLQELSVSRTPSSFADQVERALPATSQRLHRYVEGLTRGDEEPGRAFSQR